MNPNKTNVIVFGRAFGSFSVTYQSIGYHPLPRTLFHCPPLKISALHLTSTDHIMNTKTDMSDGISE